MRILISQQEYIKPPRFFVFDALERIYYTFLAGQELIPAPNIRQVIDCEYDCLMLTGGPDSVSRNLTENLLFEHANKRQLPIIGICHGAFALNDLSGGINGRVDGHVSEDHTITMNGINYLVNSYHEQSIAVLPDNFVASAHDQDGNVEAFKHRQRPHWGIVWHPERMTKPVLPADLADFLRTAYSDF